MRPSRIVIASRNPDKVDEVEEILGTLALPVEVVKGLNWPEVNEIGATLEENALLKARAVVARVGIAALGDDTGLEVNALGGAPGVRTARYAGPNATYADNLAHLLKRMEGEKDREATFRTAVALVDEAGRAMTAEGRLAGRITESPRGGGGFGYDSVFEVRGRSLAEMAMSEKNQMSHRARALLALVEKVWGPADGPRPARGYVPPPLGRGLGGGLSGVLVARWVSALAWCRG